jgi:hypothetical protein
MPSIRLQQQQTAVANENSNGASSSSAGATVRPVGRKQAKTQDDLKRKLQQDFESFVKSFNKRQNSRDAASQEDREY